MGQPRNEITKIEKIIEESYKKSRNEVLRRTSVLIFGPGKNSEQFHLRLKLQNALKRMGCRADFPEDFITKVNIIIKESILAKQYNLIYVLLISLGPSLEFTHYIHQPKLAQKFRLFQESKYCGKDSFANELIKHFCELYKHCYLFDGEEELIKKARRCLDYYINFVMVYKRRPY